MARVEEALAQITGRPWGLRIESGGDGGAAPDPGPAADDTAARPAKPQPELLQTPLLKHARDVLGAQVVRMDEGFGATPDKAPDRDGGEEE